MNNTKKSFKNKWEKNKVLAFESTLNPNSEINKWILNRNGFKNINDFKAFLSDKKRILDAGCGNGRVTALISENSIFDSEIFGIDLVSQEVAKKNLEDYNNVSIIEKDLMEDLSSLGQFDFIYCQEVLHHTTNPFLAFKNLTSLVAPKGEIAIYVYKKKAPTREFVDDFVRNKIKDLDYDEAIKVCEEITLLGKALYDLNLKIELPEVKVLDIKSGKYEIQRFFYHFFMKCFWNKELSLNDNVAINYDWYHPQNCTRHTEEEVKEWFKSVGFKINHIHVDFYGITAKGENS